MTVVDKDKCIGCGMCISICPEIFKMDKEGKSKVISEENSECVKEAINNCPVNAISE